jgi:guanyl-specific ribonuclease Sa
VNSQPARWLRLWFLVVLTVAGGIFTISSATAGVPSASASAGIATVDLPTASSGYGYDSGFRPLGRAPVCATEVGSSAAPFTTSSGAIAVRPRSEASTGVAAEAEAAAFPRFVASKQGIIDTQSPALRQQVGDVVGSMRTTGAPPSGVYQGGLPGKPGVYGNKSGALPPQPLGYYHETDVWPLSGPRGTERIVTGDGGEAWYTPDHYGTFMPWPW